MPFTNTDSARYGLVAMYAMDMNRQTGNEIPKFMPQLEAAGWSILAYIMGQDALFRDARFDILQKIKYYGFLAQHTDGSFIVVIRGTDGFLEWIEDAEFVPMIYQPKVALPGSVDIKVEQGFWNLYRTLKLVDATGRTTLGSVADAIPGLCGDTERVVVVGHSLGAALSTYLTLDLVSGALGDRVSACLFASPHTGNKAFTDYFDAAVKDYRLFNYILDVVPRVPLGPDYTALPRRTVIQPATAEARIRVDIACNHHVVCYCAMLDYESTIAALKPPPDGEAASAACILGPETGHPSLGKQIVAALAGIVPV